MIKLLTDSYLLVDNDITLDSEKTRDTSSHRKQRVDTTAWVFEVGIEVGCDQRPDQLDILLSSAPSDTRDKTWKVYKGKICESQQSLTRPSS